MGVAGGGDDGGGSLERGMGRGTPGRGGRPRRRSVRAGRPLTSRWRPLKTTAKAPCPIRSLRENSNLPTVSRPPRPDSMARAGPGRPGLRRRHGPGAVGRGRAPSGSPGCGRDPTPTQS